MSIKFIKKHGEPSRRYGRKTAQGAWQPPDLCAMVTAWFRQRRNCTSPIRSRADQTTLAAGGRRHRPQPSSAVVSAVVTGLLSGGRVLPHTAFVLTWFKIKKRQASVSGALCSLECFCRKMFRHCSLLELLRFLRKSSGNGRMCQGVNCVYLNLL